MYEAVERSWTGMEFQREVLQKYYNGELLRDAGQAIWDVEKVYTERGVHWDIEELCHYVTYRQELWVYSQYVVELAASEGLKEWC